MSHASGSGDGVDIQSKVPDEQQQKVTGTNEGVGVRPDVSNVPKYALGKVEESWTFGQNEDDADEETYMNDDNEETESENDGDDLTHLNLSTYKANGKEEEEEKADDVEVSSDHRVYTPPDHQITNEEENQEGDDKVKEGEEEQNKEEELYEDLDINLQRSGAKKTDAQQEIVQANHFDQWVSALETEMSQIKQTSQFVDAVSLILSIVDNYLASKMKDAVDVVVQLLTNKLREEAQAENQKYLNQVDSTMKNLIKEGKSISQQIRHLKESYNALVESYNSDKDIFSSYGDVVTLKRGRDDQDKDEDSSVRSNRGSKGRRSGKKAESSKALDDDESRWNPSSSLTPDREWHKTKIVDNRPPQPWITQMAQAACTKSLFNKFLDTSIDFSAFIMNRLKIDNMTQEVLTGLTYDLIKGTCKSVVELEYHLEEVFKATNNQLDWHNPKGKPYPYDLSKPLPLIQNERGR
nr:hypothetical protein [Tanacetum cinerariifolium]